MVLGIEIIAIVYLIVTLYLMGKERLFVSEICESSLSCFGYKYHDSSLWSRRSLFEFGCYLSIYLLFGEVMSKTRVESETSYGLSSSSSGSSESDLSRTPTPSPTMSVLIKGSVDASVLYSDDARGRGCGGRSGQELVTLAPQVTNAFGPSSFDETSLWALHELRVFLVMSR